MQRTGTDHRRCLAAEGERAVAAGTMRSLAPSRSAICARADGELLIAVEIGEPDAQPFAAERRADDETQRLILERAFIDRDEPGGPGADPFLATSSFGALRPPSLLRRDP